jgi:hypothetical protein
MLTKALRVYLSVTDEKSARESLLTQVSYALGSLERLGVGGVKGCIVKEEEYVNIAGKQKVLTGRPA